MYHSIELVKKKMIVTIKRRKKYLENFSGDGKNYRMINLFSIFFLIFQSIMNKKYDWPVKGQNKYNFYF